jgi:predicted phage tail protein|tara:strand:+ start:39 stop:1052 length:1014 start_codon:yes stop_codon:yes gene_type:complete
MLTKIKLYGHLKEATGHTTLEAKASNTADAVKFLIANFPKLEHEMANQYYKVSVNNIDIDETELHDPIGFADIKIIPVIAGSGRGLGKILLGAALIGGAFLFGGLSFGGSFKAFGKSLASKSLFGAKGAFYLGSFLVLSGLAELFTPEVKPEAEDPLSASFSNTVNTTLATVPIPILYGEYIVGSVVISAGIETAEGSPGTSNSSIGQDNRGNTVSMVLDENTGDPVEEYDRDNADISLRRYVRIYSVSSVKVKVEAVVGNNTYQGTGFTNNGDEIITAFRQNNQNQFNTSIAIKSGNTRYVPGNLKETIGTHVSGNRPSTGANDGYYYGLVTGTVS